MSHAKADLVAAFEDAWTHQLRLLDDLSDEEWTIQSPCPDWDVRGVVTHLLGVTKAVADHQPDITQPPDFAALQDFQAGLADASNKELVDAYREVIESRRAQLAAITQEEVDSEAFTPVGTQTYGRFMAIRIFDHWVHEQDIRWATNRPGHDSGPSADIALDEVERTWGYIIGKRVGAPDGAKITVNVIGATSRTIHAVVDGRAAQVPTLDDPNTTVQIPFVPFMMLACGRIDPATQLADIKIEGDQALGEQIATDLAFTM